MKGSFTLGRWLGIDVRVPFTFLLLLAVVGVAQGLADRSLAGAVSGVLFFAGLFLCRVRPWFPQSQPQPQPQEHSQSRRFLPS